MLIDGIDASYVDLADPTFLDFGYVRRIGDVIDVAWPEGMPIAAVHLGGAGATLPRYIRATRPRSRQVVFEISADVLDAQPRTSRPAVRRRAAGPPAGRPARPAATRGCQPGPRHRRRLRRHPGAGIARAAPRPPSRSPACCDPAVSTC